MLALVKLWFFNNQIFANPGIQQIIFWILTCVIIAAIVRRFGLISFLEAFFLIIVWTLGNLLLDLLLVSNYTGLSIFHTQGYWVSFLVMDASIFILHKKRHIHIRKELRAQAHGHSHGAGQGGHH